MREKRIVESLAPFSGRQKYQPVQQRTKTLVLRLSHPRKHEPPSGSNSDDRTNLHRHVDTAVHIVCETCVDTRSAYGTLIALKTSSSILIIYF